MQKKRSVAQAQIESLSDITFQNVTSLIITTINRSRIKITRIFVCKCQYKIETFAKILIGIKMVEKHKTRKNQQTFYKCNMSNNTIKD